MGKLKEIRNIRDKETLMIFVRDNRKLLIMILLPAAVACAVLFFWIAGGEREITVDDEYGIGGETGGEWDEDLTEDGDEYADRGSEDSAVPVAVMIYVDISGEVKNPGVYEIEQGTRLFQVINLAGGMTEKADRDSINQAETVTDGQKIIVGSTDENSPYYTGEFYQNSGGAGNSGSDAAQGGNSSSGGVVFGGEFGFTVNINIADDSELQLIPGIGPVTAGKIIEYRQENGPFAQKEDIMKISGIGQKTYDSLKDYICV